MDQTVPGLGGREAFKAMRRLDHGVPVILTSCYGHPEQGVAMRGQAGVLKKPLRLAEVQGLLHRIFG